MSRRVLLLEPDTGRRWLVAIDGLGPRQVAGLGVFDPARADVPAGTRTDVAGKRLLVLDPTPVDLDATLRRKAQIILPKDLAPIVHHLGLAPGMRVFESGMGSGAATLRLLQAVAPGGRVVVQELRQDFADWATENVVQAGLEGGLEVHLGDTSAGLAPGVQGPFDAVLLDLPEPEKALRHIAPALAPGARIACYCPQVSQMERAVRMLWSLDAADVRATETIEREWEVKERGSRPSFAALGHTGFLVFARWLA